MAEMSDHQELARLVNEYTAVRIGIDQSAARPRLRIASDRTGDVILLDATALEAIASLDHRGIGLLVGAFSETGTASDALSLAADQPPDGPQP
jgi:hypothetical protein